MGVAMRDSEMADLLEKQADLIHYLKDHNIKLNQKLMTLNAQLRASSGNILQNWKWGKNKISFAYMYFIAVI